MERDFLAKNVEADVLQKIKSIYALASQKKSTHEVCLDNFLKFRNSSSDKEVEILDQALNDALLNSMATLIDYYCIYCMINIGVDFEKITRVQYRLIGKKYLIENSTLEKEEKDILSLDLFRRKFEERLSASCGMDIGQVNLHDYWTGYVADAISTTLNAYGVLKNKRIELKFDQVNNCFIFDDKISEYHHCMRFLYCNPSSNTGVRYNIYLDINNYLKHNSIPRIMRRIEEFPDPQERRIYSFFEISSYKSIFLKDGFLRDILEMDFDSLGENLKIKSIEGRLELCPLERRWEIGPIIAVDNSNGFISDDGETLFFFVDSVFLAKTKKSILIDSESSFRSVLGCLIEGIEGGLEYFRRK
ncbi:hypothetical protein [Xanthomonas sp. 3075]|uniref:hypothetical protein n=1 Tax=Xanthomonas sp. 3075 TaxID=3035315 RepID=UPI00160EFDE6|nr:hypothetical protein [Xanthomonas sp. 3075]MBB4132487.1 hypothetical protein [Xanthomonas sp. 3075]